MRLNADFSQRVVMRADQIEWTPSPMPGVERKMLDRIGDEIARATTIVRYAPGSAFSAHTHDGGEEFIVLDGVFSDEHGDYAAGSYVRNPPTSSHSPRSDAGTTILVKTHQFDLADRTHVRIDASAAHGHPSAERAGVRVTPLFADQREDVRIEDWAPCADVSLALDGGLELFVLEGAILEGEDRLQQNDWLRLPAGSKLSAKAGEKGARLWIKTGHLPPRDVAGAA